MFLIILSLSSCNDTILIPFGSSSDSGQSLFYAPGTYNNLPGEDYIYLGNESITITTTGTYEVFTIMNYNGTAGSTYKTYPLIDGVAVSSCNTVSSPATTSTYGASMACLTNLTAGDVVTYGVVVG